jgi:hypothetical protein
VAKLVNEFQSQWGSDLDRERGASLREFLFPGVQPNLVVTNEATSKRLKLHLGSPVMLADQTFTLKDRFDKTAKSLRFHVVVSD